jgi:NADPH2:quinone reductase
MHAIVVHQFGGPDVMKLESKSEPEAAPGRVVVRLRAIGVNPVDTYVRSGAYAVRPQLPYTPGMDGGGEIASVGAGVTNVAVGDRVYVWTAQTGTGTYAELVGCEAARAYPLPAQAHSSRARPSAFPMPRHTVP